jgi:SOS-response transcriptional repressor LexA
VILDPSPRQRDVLQLFVDAARLGDPAPTYREICDAIGITGLKCAVEHVAALVKKGWLERGSRGAARSVTLTDHARAAHGLPRRAA